MMIRYCLSLAAKSPACYDEIRNSGILVLPSLRTLRDYKNYIRQEPGFQDKVVDELKKITSKFFGHQRYIVLLVDEMKIKSGLVYEKSSNKLIGFVDLGDADVTFATMEESKSENLASHALVFMVKGLSTTLTFSLAYFGTENATACQMFPLFW